MPLLLEICNCLGWYFLPHPWLFSQLVHDSDEIVKKKERKILKRHFPEKNKTLSAAPPNLHHNFFFAELQHYCSREQFSTLCVIPVINLLKGNGSNFPEWWTSPYYIFQGYDIGAKRYFFSENRWMLATLLLIGWKKEIIFVHKCICDENLV